MSCLCTTSVETKLREKSIEKKEKNISWTAQETLFFNRQRKMGDHLVCVLLTFEGIEYTFTDIFLFVLGFC